MRTDERGHLLQAVSFLIIFKFTKITVSIMESINSYIKLMEETTMFDKIKNYFTEVKMWHGTKAERDALSFFAGAGIVAYAWELWMYATHRRMSIFKIK